MEENKYQKLGARTLAYDIVRRSKIALVFLLAALALVLVKKYFGSSSSGSGTTNIIDPLIHWVFLATLAVFVITILVAWLEYVMFQFRLDTDIFKVKRGVFTKIETAIPYRRIESVDIRRTIFHQLFGVSRITIETTIDSEATSDSKSNADDEVFPVIDHTVAQSIQEELTKRANVQKMRM
jgi:uncharacterized membrane protein YdbT with pleckstrin-like domain